MAGVTDIFGKLVSSVQSQISRLTTWTKKVQTFATTATQAVTRKFQEFLRTLTNPPKSKKDYVRLMGIYFSKKFLIITMIVICVGGPLVTSYVWPWMEGFLWAATIRVDSKKFTTFSGKARLVDQTGNLIYEGKVENGMPVGYGVHYDSKGRLLYKGEFKNGKYNGAGEFFFESGKILYNGEFQNNEFNGKGKLYNSIGKLLYVGEFSEGKKAGKGIKFDEKTALKVYFGEFSNDLEHGVGVKYTEDGESVLFEGEFEYGLYSGTGKLYEGRKLIYSGKFLNGLYDGKGTLYDSETGYIIYDGNYKDGQYNGSGKLYVNGNLTYEGTFNEGQKQGSGTSYDKLGSKSFEGTFRSDSVDYISYLGKKVDEVTEKFGTPTFKTEVNSKLILTYVSLDSSIVFKIDTEKNEYICEKVIIGTKEKFLGLSTKSLASDIRTVMGDPFTTTNFECPEYYKTIFSHLSIVINNTKKVPCDKYIPENTDKYYVKFYFNDGKTELKFIEIGSL